jgi:hypothetical protein
MVHRGVILDADRPEAPVYRPNIEDEHAGHFLACPRYPVAKLLHLLPPKFLTQLQENDKIAECCRDAVKHEIEAWYSSAADRDKGIPDIYIMHCACGREHRRFCVGGSERPPLAIARGSKRDETAEEYAAVLRNSKRPFWEVR